MQGLIGEIVDAISPKTEADPAALAVQTLTYLGNAFGRGAHFYVGATQHFANLFC